MYCLARIHASSSIREEHFTPGTTVLICPNCRFIAIRQTRDY